MTPQEITARAKTAIGHKIVYKLGDGPATPKEELPKSADGGCDCSAFVAWALGVSKYMHGVPWYDAKHNGEWMNTDAVVRDAQSPFGFWDQIKVPEVGCAIVYGKSAKMPVGHIGLVSEVVDGKATKVIHCSSGNFHKFQDAIQETVPTVFTIQATTIFARYAGVENSTTT